MWVLTIELLPNQPSRWSTGFSLENGAWLSKGSPGRLQRHQRSAALYSIGSQFLSSHMWFQNGPNGTCEGPSWLSVNGSSPQEWPVNDCLRRNYSLGQHKSLDIQTSPFWKIKLIHLPAPNTLVPLIKRKFYLVPFPYHNQISQTWHSIKSRLQRSVWFRHEGNFVKSISATEKIASHQ